MGGEASGSVGARPRMGQGPHLGEEGGLGPRPEGGIVLAQVFLGDNLLAWIILALGGALACGNAMALLRPPRQPREGELTRAPVGRSLFMGALGLVAAIWALATLSR